ncbi:hypothetical protein BGZ54_010023 [Gamsiella multidivaricata]|nr:hypothetical protein BGZ54_010023 [Gamsiella multidivaricata]
MEVGVMRQYSSDSKSSSTTASTIDSDRSRHGDGIKTRQSADGKWPNTKNGGDSRQLSIDPWLSAEAIASEKDTRSSRGFRSSREVRSHRQYPLAELSRRTSSIKSRFEHEPMVLMSTSATTPGLLRDETPGPKFTSPRKQALDVIEVNCSDSEETTQDDTRARMQTAPKYNSNSTAHSNMFRGKAVSPLKMSPNRRRLIRTSALYPSINVISSDDDESDEMPTTLVSHRKFVKEIVESSDDDLDELSRDASRNVLKTDISRPRNPRHPIADDTIPRSPERPETLTAATSSTPLGSSAKMPWSITEGPDRDIVLSTPTLKQRTRHYDMVRDSEDDLSEAEECLVISETRRRKSSSRAEHVGLPKVESVMADDRRKSLSRAIVSDSEAEIGVSDATQAERDEIYTVSQSTVGGRDGMGERAFSIESQDIYELCKQSRSSPTENLHNKQTYTRLTKPRPLILDIPSDDDNSQDVVEILKRGDTAGLEEEHRKLRETLMFTDHLDDKAPSSKPDWPQGRKLDTENGQRSPFVAFPIFNRTTKRANMDEQGRMADMDSLKEYYPSWKKPSESDGKRPHTEILSAMIGREDEQDDEPLEDPRARRRSGRATLASPPKKMRISEVAPDISAMESALKAAADHSRQQADIKKPAPPAKMETIDSFSTMSDSQPLITGVYSSKGRGALQTEEIEDFSDDQRSQRSQKARQSGERKLRRYSGLQLGGRAQPRILFEDSKKDRVVDRGKDIQREQRESQQAQQQPRYDDQGQDTWPKQDEQFIRDISPILSQNAMDRCPICRKMVPVEDLIAHVDAELLANEQKEREDMQKRDEAMALALDEIYQTQDVVHIKDSFAESDTHTQAPALYSAQIQGQSLGNQPALISSKAPTTIKGVRNSVLSLDSPIRKVNSLSLDSPPPITRTREQDRYRDSAGYSGVSTVFSEESANYSADQSRVLEDDEPLDFADFECLSSQSAFHIQPGQAIDDAAAAESLDGYISVRPISRKKKTAATKLPKDSKKFDSGNQDTPLVIQDEKLEDDLDDFLDRPEPASMLNRSFRTRGKAAGSATRCKPATKQPSKGVVELDDSENDNNAPVGTKQTTATRKGAKSKSAILDNILPESARQRRQHLLKKARGQRGQGDQSKRHLINEDDEIEIGRLMPVVEKLWNQEDDLLHSEQLDRRQVKGVGLGGIVGGIGAVPGSLAVSKITVNRASTIAAADTDHKVIARSEDLLGKSIARTDDSGILDDFTAGPSSFEIDDPNYGLQSQEWWDAADPGNIERSRRHEGEETDGLGGAVEEDNGYMSPLDDFVDLRKRRDDPALAMYFAQFGMGDNTDAENTGPAGALSGERGRRGSRGRGRSRGGSTSGTGKGVSYGPGVGPILTTTGTGSNVSGLAAGQAVLTAYGIPKRAGSTATIVGGHATTANGSMAIRSKPTQSFVPGRGRGNKSNYHRGRWHARGRGRGGSRGRGRGRDL